MAIFRNKKILYTSYTLGIFLFFLWYLFPSDFFADFLENTIRKNGNGLEISIEHARPTLSLSLALRGVTCTIPEGPTIKAEAFTINPGLISLIKGTPKISFDMKGFGGRIYLKIIIPEKNVEKLTFDEIKVSHLDLAMIKDILASIIPGYTVRGILDAEGHYTKEGRGNGELMIKLKDLVVEPDKPLFTIKNLNFNNVAADFEIKSKKVEIRQCEVDGKEVNGSVTGSIFIREPFDRSTLRLTGTVRPEKEFLKALSSVMPVEALLGKKMNDEGEIPFRVSGVVNDPRYSLR